MKAYFCRRKKTLIWIAKTFRNSIEGNPLPSVNTGEIGLSLGVTDLTAFESSQFGDAAENWKLLSKLKNLDWMSSQPTVKIVLLVNEDESGLIVNMDMQGPLLDNLIQSLGHLNLKLTLQITALSASGHVVGSGTPDANFCEMIICSGDEGQKNGAFCKQSGGGLSRNFINQIDASNYFSVEISLIVSADKERDLSGEGNQGNLSCLDVNRKLLMEEVRTDLEIIAGNGVAVKCLSAFLIVQSEVIRAMLESDMQESKEGRILMEDVSEEGVRALLAYLYYRDLGIPVKSSLLTVELLEVGHRYLIGGMEGAMKGILLDKPVKWFEANAAVRLFFFAGKLDNHKDLKRKAVQVLQSKPNEVMACGEYQRLFQVEAESGGMEGIGGRLQGVKELCDALLSATVLPPPPSSSAVG